MDAVTELQKSLKTLEDTSYDSIDSLMRKIMKKHDVTAKELHNGFKSEYGKTPDDYINEDLRDWFGKGGKGGVGGGGWDRYNSKGEREGKCARENPSDPKPKCLSKSKANRLRSQGGAKAIASAVKRKRKADPVADRKGKGGKPIMVSNKLKEAALGVDDAVTQPDIVKYTDTPEVQNSPAFSAIPRYCTKCKKVETQAECAYGPKAWVIYSVPPRLQTVFGEETELPEEKIVIESLSLEERVMLSSDAIILEKNEPTNPGLWSKMVSKAKSKFDVYPSAYANGWAAKQYKSAGGSWKSKTKKESVTIEDADGNTFAEVVDIVSVEDMQNKEELKANIAERRAQEIEEQKNAELEEAVRLPSTNGNFYTVSLIWRMKMYVVKMFFPKVGMVSRMDVNDEIQKIYHGAKLVSYELSTEQPGTPFIQVTKFNGGDRGGAVFDSQTAFTGPGIPEEVEPAKK